MISIKKIAVTVALMAAIGMMALVPIGTSGGTAGLASADDGSKTGGPTVAIDSDQVRRASEYDHVLDLVMAQVMNRTDLETLNAIAQEGRLVDISRNTVTIALLDPRTYAAALEVAGIIEQVLSEMVGADVGVEFIIGDPFSNSSGKDGKSEDADGQIIGGSSPGSWGGILPGGSDNGGSGASKCDASRPDYLDLGSPLARGLMDGNNEDQPKDDKKDGSGGNGANNGNGNDNGNGNNNSNGNDNGNSNNNGNGGEGENKSGFWEGVKNFFKGVAGALTGTAGSAAMSQPTDVEGARDVANGIIGSARQGKTGTISEHAADQLKQIDWGNGRRGTQDHPDIGGASDPCEGYNWFRENLPHLTGTPWDPYARLDTILDSDPTRLNPCDPNVNPGPDGSCEQDEPEVELDTSRPSVEGLGPDCDNIEGCGQAAVTPAAAEKVMRYSDPSDPCGIYANTGPDGDCDGEGENVEVPSGPQPWPDCEVCGAYGAGPGNR